MRLDRLLSIVVYLLNRDLVSARVLAERFGVSTRTIQRDMEAINLAGIPVITVQGPSGGYGIMENFRLDRSLVTADDLFYIVSALKGIATTLDDDRIGLTLEKVQSLIPDRGGSARSDRLYVDYGEFSGGPGQREAFQAVRDAVEEGRLLEFEYTSNRLERTARVVEPMTIVFRWRSWYLFGYCRLREDYRLFRIARIRRPRVLAGRFNRRGVRYDDYARQEAATGGEGLVDLTLRFKPEMAALVEEFHAKDDLDRGEDGSLVVRMTLPEDGWLYGYILSFGPYVTVLEPERLRSVIRDAALGIAGLYE